MEALSAERCLALRAEASWRSSLKLPEEPPWVYQKAATLTDRPKQGIVRRPQIHPPPVHIPTPPQNVEVAEQEAGSLEFRRRLEERFKDDVALRRDGHVVFDDATAYSIPSNQVNLKEWIKGRVGTVESNDQPSLAFESRFESGNLRKAVQVGPREYDLSLRPDKDSGHVQWYYFMVSNIRSGIPYTFNIVNFVKQKSLYNQGLKPLLYSTLDAKNKKVGWKRSGSKCAYYSRSAKYTLTFTIHFENDGDTCFLAHCYPYTYTDLQLFLSSLESSPERRQLFTRKELCRSLADNRVDLITITDPEEESEPRKSILLTARVHPGETQASWSMQGCIQFLTSDDPAAKLLRQRFTMHIVPMLNPDGVINGHYRCSLAGQDLNRLWAEPDIVRHPCIWHVKNLVRQLTHKGLVFFCDFHGHSTKRNAFMYGCEPPGRAGEPRVQPSVCAAFPGVLAELAPAFSLSDCDYRIHKNKVTTGRVVVSREFGVALSYTLEVSFLGHKVGPSLVHFSLDDLLLLGRRFGDALAKFHIPTHYHLVSALRRNEVLVEGGVVGPDDGKGESPLSAATTLPPDDAHLTREAAAAVTDLQSEPQQPAESSEEEDAGREEAAVEVGGIAEVSGAVPDGQASAVEILDDMAAFSLCGWDTEQAEHDVAGFASPEAAGKRCSAAQEYREGQGGQAAATVPAEGGTEEGEEEESAAEESGSSSDHESDVEAPHGLACAVPEPAPHHAVAGAGEHSPGPNCVRSMLGDMPLRSPHALSDGDACVVGRALRTGSLWARTGTFEGAESLAVQRDDTHCAGPDRTEARQRPDTARGTGGVLADRDGGRRPAGDAVERCPTSGSASSGLGKARSDGSLARQARHEGRAESSAGGEQGRDLAAGEAVGAPWTLTASRRPAEDREKKEGREGREGRVANASSKPQARYAAAARASRPPTLSSRHFASGPAHRTMPRPPEAAADPSRTDKAEVAAGPSGCAAVGGPRTEGSSVAGLWRESPGMSRSWRQEKPRRDEPARHSFAAPPWGVLANAAPAASGSLGLQGGGGLGGLLGGAGPLYASVSLPSIVGRESGEVAVSGGLPALGGDLRGSNVARLLALSLQAPHPRPLLHSDSEPAAMLSRLKSVGRHLDLLPSDIQTRPPRTLNAAPASSLSCNPAPARREERESPTSQSARAGGREGASRQRAGPKQQWPLTPSGGRGRGPGEQVLLPKPTLVPEYA